MFLPRLLIFLLPYCSTLAQNVQTSTAEFDLGTRCEGEIITFGIDQEFSCFKRKVGVCSSSFADEFENKSNDILVENASVMESSGYSVNADPVPGILTPLI